MKSAKTITILGLLVMVAPFSGLPSSWNAFLFVVLGGVIAFLAFRITPTHAQASQQAEEHTSSHTVETDHE